MTIVPNRTGAKITDFVRLKLSKNFQNNLVFGLFGTSHSYYTLSCLFKDFQTTQPFGPVVKAVAIGSNLYDAGISISYDKFLLDDLTCNVSLSGGLLIPDLDKQPEYTDLGQEAKRIQDAVNALIDSRHKSVPFLSPGVSIGYKWVYLNCSYLQPLTRNILSDVESEEFDYQFIYRKRLVQLSLGLKYNFR